MIRKAITMVSPLVMKVAHPKYSYLTYQHRRALKLTNKMWFCSQKGKKAEKPQEQKQEKKSQKQQQQNQQIKQQEDKKVKMSKLTTEELIEINSEQSLGIVESRIKALQKQSDKNSKSIDELNKKLQFFEKHHSELTDKEEKLLENLKQQDLELNRIHKRSQKEIEDSKDYAITKLAKQLIETADNIKRCKEYASKLVEQNPKDPFINKIILSHQQMADLLKLYQIQEFDPTGELFDPNTSQSLVTIPCPPGFKVNHVAMAMQTGFRIKSRILRSARVGIFV